MQSKPCLSTKLCGGPEALARLVENARQCQRLPTSITARQIGRPQREFHFVSSSGRGITARRPVGNFFPGQHGRLREYPKMPGAFSYTTAINATCWNSTSQESDLTESDLHDRLAHRPQGLKKNSVQTIPPVRNPEMKRPTPATPPS